MIAGHETDRLQKARERYIWGMVMFEEEVLGVQRHATPEEAVVIEAYRVQYREAMGRWPHGLIYLQLPTFDDTVGVWFGPVD